MGFLQYLTGTKDKETEPLVSGYDQHLKRKQNKLHVKDGKAAINVSLPKTFQDVEAVIVKLRKNAGAVVDLRNAPSALGQRFLDYLSGAVFGLGGSIERLEQKMFLLTTKGVSVIVNEKDLKECGRKSQKNNGTKS